MFVRGIGNMRELVLNVVKEIIYDMQADGLDIVEEIGVSLEEVDVLTDEKLLEVYTNLLGFQG